MAGAKGSKGSMESDAVLITSPGITSAFEMATELAGGRRALEEKIKEALESLVLEHKPLDQQETVTNAFEQVIIKRRAAEQRIKDFKKIRNRSKLANRIANPILMRELASPAEVRKQIFEASNWYTAEEVSERAGYEGKNSSTMPNRWKKNRQIIALNLSGKDRFPAYALGDDGKPLKIMARIIEVFEGKRTDLSMATWFCSLNSYLGDKAPMDVISTHPDEVLEAAEREVAGIEQG